mmetsp:Transcript_26390/g.78041  ORF Transcript_26390/g.78041 Transcript_26390/m.78041 type:complete len:236 (+) Transcript_26390:710-1417(+)
MSRPGVEAPPRRRVPGRQDHVPRRRGIGRRSGQHPESVEDGSLGSVSVPFHQHRRRRGDDIGRGRGDGNLPKGPRGGEDQGHRFLGPLRAHGRAYDRIGTRRHVHVPDQFRRVPLRRHWPEGAGLGEEEWSGRHCAQGRGSRTASSAGWRRRARAGGIPSHSRMEEEGDGQLSRCDEQGSSHLLVRARGRSEGTQSTHPLVAESIRGYGCPAPGRSEFVGWRCVDVAGEERGSAF